MTPTPTASGLLLVHNGRLLLLRRRLDCDAGGCWAYPGGKIEPGETPEQAARRELQEETGLSLADGPLLPLGVSPDGFMAFAAKVDQAVAPTLNDEHTAFEWAAFDALPAPLHPNMQDQLYLVGNLPAYIRRVAQRL